MTNFMCPCHRQLISDLFAITRNLWKSFGASQFYSPFNLWSALFVALTLSRTNPTMERGVSGAKTLRVIDGLEKNNQIQILRKSSKYAYEIEIYIFGIITYLL